MDQHAVYIGIGTNIEPRRERMFSAIDALGTRWTIVAKSSLYETSPVGFTEQAPFLNAVVSISTIESPHELHRRLKALEYELGRQQRERWHEREIDYDILFYDDLIINDEGLTIPHPELHKRSFVLIPLAEIDLEFIHPILHKTIQTLLAGLHAPDQTIEKISDE